MRRLNHPCLKQYGIELYRLFSQAGVKIKRSLKQAPFVDCCIIYSVFFSKCLFPEWDVKWYILMRKTAILTDPGLLGPCRKPRASWRGPTCFQINTGGGQRFIVLTRFFVGTFFFVGKKGDIRAGIPCNRLYSLFWLRGHRCSSEIRRLPFQHIPEHSFEWPDLNATWEGVFTCHLAYLTSL